MKTDHLKIGARALALLLVSSPALPAQTISGVADKGQYTGQVTFTVAAEAGFDITATLNGQAVPVGSPHLVDRMDFYELVALRTPAGGGTTTSSTVRFIVISPNRGTPERGLIEWTPYPLINSTAAEFAGARLDLIVPQDYPPGLEIPVVAWVRDTAGNEVRANGMITAAGHEDHPVRILRGAGSGFLPAAVSPGTISYQARLQGLANDKDITIDAATVWTPVSGTLSGATTWAANSRIHLDADVTIPAGASLTIGEGSVVKIDPGVDITNSGAMIINGTVTRPVVLTSIGHVSPHVHTNAWGGFVMRGSEASLVATGTIMVGGGSATSWSFSPGSSHRNEQAVLFAHEGAAVSLTDSAVLNSAGQVGNGYNSDVTCERTLLQRAITAGEYVGGIITLRHSALIEFPGDNGEVDATIADADYDAIYFTTGTHILEDSLIGFCKDDAIDSGSGGAGTVEVRNCWLESSLHEAMAWSGEGRVTDTFDTVVINNGQGFECGWSTGSNSPICHGENMLLTGNAVGARFGDNYDWDYNGQLEVTNSLILHNYRNVWGYNWDDWTYRVAQMDVQGNRVTGANPMHPNNTVWDAAADAALLVPFMTTPATAEVGIGIATWENQSGISAIGDGVPVRLSSFTTQPVSVSYHVQDGSAATLDNGTLTFEPGETVKVIPVNVNDPAGHDLIRVSLSGPVNGELTGAKSFYFVGTRANPAPDVTILPRGSDWKYHDKGQDLGTTWRESTFGDAAWSEGPAELGGGDGGEPTVIDIGPAGGRWPTVYFRKTITVPDPGLFGSLNFGLRRDDGAVIYVNGAEVYRDGNVPAGATYGTYATGLTPSETAYEDITVSASVLEPGANVIAVELHQESATSSDLSFDLDLIATPLSPQPELKIANFGRELLLYWLDPFFNLEEADAPSGPWSPMNATSPVEFEPAQARQFFRLSGF